MPAPATRGRRCDADAGRAPVRADPGRSRTGRPAGRCGRSRRGRARRGASVSAGAARAERSRPRWAPRPRATRAPTARRVAASVAAISGPFGVERIPLGPRRGRRRSRRPEFAARRAGRARKPSTTSAQRRIVVACSQASAVSLTVHSRSVASSRRAAAATTTRSSRSSVEAMAPASVSRLRSTALTRPGPGAREGRVLRRDQEVGERAGRGEGALGGRRGCRRVSGRRIDRGGAGGQRLRACSPAPRRARSATTAYGSPAASTSASRSRACRASSVCAVRERGERRAGEAGERAVDGCGIQERIGGVEEVAPRGRRRDRAQRERLVPAPRRRVSPATSRASARRWSSSSPMPLCWRASAARSS